MIVRANPSTYRQRLRDLVNAALLFGAASLLAAPHVLGCGSPPPIQCARSTTLVKAFAGPMTIAATGGPVNIPVSVFVSATTNANPPCPASLSTDITLTSSCNLPPDAPPTGITINTPVSGLYSGNVITVFFPPGPPRVCTIVGVARTVWGDGSLTFGRGDVTICLVDPAPNDPTIPRLDMELLTPAEARAHPGDQRGHMARLTNNDPIQTVTGTFTSSSNQNGRLSTMMPPAPMGSGDGAGSTAAPFSGDALPLDFGSPLVSPCVVLGDPGANTIFTITQPVTLLPGESKVVEVRQRSFTTCRSGSCSEAILKFEGIYSDSSPALACAQVSFMVDSSVSPQFEWADSGMMARALPAGPEMVFQANLPTHSTPMQISAETTINSPPNFFQFQGGNSQVMDQNYGDNMGRLTQFFQVFPPLNLGQPAQVTLNIDLTSLNPGLNATNVMSMVIPGDPLLGDAYFLLKTRSRLSGPAVPPTLDSFFDVFYTVSLDGISGGLHRPSRIFPGSITAAPTGPTTLTVTFSTAFDPMPGLPPVVERIEVHLDPIGAAVGPPPRHDNCFGAYPVSEGVQFSGDTTNAIGTIDGPPGSCTSGLFHSVWHTFTPATNGNFRIDTCGTNYDSVLVAFLATPDCNVLAEVGCDDDSSTGTVPSCTPNGLASRIESIPLLAGQTYYLRVGGFNATTNFGPYKLLVTRLVAQSGACCCGSTCTLATGPSGCGGPNTSFAGAGTVCNPPGNNTAPCCKADYNRSGAVGVQDIFDFLAAFFGGNGCTDINGSGPPPSPQDIFDFLAAYFAGC